jgi:hypothetical protein
MTFTATTLERSSGTTTTRIEFTFPLTCATAEDPANTACSASDGKGGQFCVKDGILTGRADGEYSEVHILAPH